MVPLMASPFWGAQFWALKAKNVLFAYLFIDLSYLTQRVTAVTALSYMTMSWYNLPDSDVLNKLLPILYMIRLFFHFHLYWKIINIGKYLVQE